MGESTTKEKVYQEFTRIAQAIAHPKRMELIDVLSQRGRSVEELSKEVSISIASTSQHLQVLKSAQLVETKRNGNFIVYSVSGDEVLALVASVKALGFAKIAAVESLIQDFRTDRNMLASITLSELARRSQDEEVLLIDVRPAEEYAAGHIADAISIPLSRLPENLDQLDATKTIVAYCRGPLCVMSADAVAILRAHGYNAVRMDEGFVEWKLQAQKPMKKQ